MRLWFGQSVELNSFVGMLLYFLGCGTSFYKPICVLEKDYIHVLLSNAKEHLHFLFISGLIVLSPNT